MTKGVHGKFGFNGILPICGGRRGGAGRAQGGRREDAGRTDGGDTELFKSGPTLRLSLMSVVRKFRLRME